MRRIIFAALLSVLGVVAVVAVLHLNRASLSRLRVVYAGDPGTEQTESFRRFLAQHVKSVTVIPILDLANADLSAADVLILGGRTGLKIGGEMRVQPVPKAVTLDTVAVPTVMVGQNGSRVLADLDLKVGWGHG
jgi:hypothetical protein